MSEGPGSEVQGGFRMDADGNLRSELLAEFPWVRHGFGSRAAKLPDIGMATVKQIHSAEILDASGEAGLRGEADALISGSSGLAVGVKTADCVPILLVDKSRCVVAAIHAGWRGTVREIVKLTIGRMHDQYGSDPADIFAAIGPAIGSCCYEVGPEVARQFTPWNRDFAFTEAKEHLDLAGINLKQLLAAGVPEWQTALAGICTKCRNGEYFSFRNEGEKAGRMISWIGVA